MNSSTKIYSKGPPGLENELQSKEKKKTFQYQKVFTHGKQYIVIGKFLYNSEDELGAGAFGKVYKGYAMVKQGNDVEVAIKTMDLPDNYGILSEREKQTLDAARKEILALKMLNHPNIVKLYDVKKMNSTVFIVMELCNQRSLNEYLKANKDITELEIRYKFGQILQGFKYLRSKDIIHRDIKPENILIRNNVLKIADFGFAKQHNSEHMHTSYYGTRATIAPQVILGEYTDKCDIWSLGATLYYMCFKRYPFVKDFYANELKLMEVMKKDTIDFPKSGMAISNPLRQIIIQMLRFHERDRISWNELFASQLFQLSLLREAGLNVFEYEEDQVAEPEIEQSNIADFDFQLMDKSDQEIEKIQENVQNLIDEAAQQRKTEEIKLKLIKRITYEEGKSKFLRILSEKIQNFENQLTQKLIFLNNKVDISDRLKALKFGLNKYEVIIKTGLLEWLKINKDQSYYQCDQVENPLGVNENDWEEFLGKIENYASIQKALEKEIKITSEYVFKMSKHVLMELKELNSQAFYKMKVNEEFLSEKFHRDIQFFITLYELCIGLAKLLFPELIKIRNNLDQIHKILSTLVLLDDLFILMSLELVFIYKEDAQNFNTFFENRKVNYSQDELFYRNMFQRVLRNYEVFFE
ncbi:hypothetical protein pb186bvf_012482 [Paramecium bursaria]